MAIPNAGTFDYVALVPKNSDESGFECQGTIRESTFGGDQECLVGPAPLIRVSDGGLTPDAGLHRPWVMRSCITLMAAHQRQATVAAASFHVDKALTSRLREGDQIHLHRTGCAGLGLSIIRDGALVAAIGAITHVPLGIGIEARVPSDLVSSAEAVFRRRDPDYAFPELPIEVSIGGSRLILSAGRRSLAHYELFVINGVFRGIPGTDACAALRHKRMAPDTATVASAMLLNDRAALRMVRWSTHERDQSAKRE